MYVDDYFGHLHNALATHHPTVDSAALEAEWRDLYAVAWADFVRFLAGWSPQHWKLDAYSLRLTKQVIAALAV